VSIPITLPHNIIQRREGDFSLNILIQTSPCIPHSTPSTRIYHSHPLPVTLTPTFSHSPHFPRPSLPAVSPNPSAHARSPHPSLHSTLRIPHSPTLTRHPSLPNPFLVSLTPQPSPHILHFSALSPYPSSQPSPAPSLCLYLTIKLSFVI